MRIGEPATTGTNKPQSLWRLYYINASTGLIDKIVSQEQGETITAEFSGWSSQNGEAAPARISWRRNGRLEMELNLNSIIHSPKQ